MTERTKLTVRPANIQISFCMNPDKSEYLLYTEWVYVVTIVKHKCFPCTKEKYSQVDRSLTGHFLWFVMHCLFKNVM